MAVAMVAESRATAIRITVAMMTLELMLDEATSVKENLIKITCNIDVKQTYILQILSN